MKAKFLSVLAVSALLFASCSNDDDQIDSNDPVAVRFTSSIAKPDNAPAVRAAGDTWAAGDAIGIFMVENTTTTTIAESATNKKHTTTGGSGFTPVVGDEIYYPVSGAAVDFIAYYPYLAGQALGNYSVDVAIQTSQPAIDLLWSKADNTGNGFSKTSTGNIPLVFDHKLSKVIIKTAAGDGLTASELAGMTVAIKGMDTKATFDLSTGMLGAYSDVADITTKMTTDGKVYEAIVLPADFAIDALQITFKVGDDVFTWKNPTAGDGKLEAGKEYTYTMTVKRTGVSFTCTINDWDTTPNDRNGTAD